MKKTYMNPVTRTVKIKVQHMIAASPNLTLSNETVDADLVESRRNRFDDDWFDNDEY